VNKEAKVKEVADVDLRRRRRRWASLRTLSAVVALSLLGGASLTLHTVRPGETLSGIGNRYGVSVAALTVANHLRDPNQIAAGTNIVIPAGAAAVIQARAVTAIAPPTVQVAASFIDVSRGDTLRTLARRSGVSPTALAAANGLVGGAVYAGARYQIPPPGAPTSAWVARQPWRCPVATRPKFMNDWGFRREAGMIHRGNDLFAPRGTAVIAPVAGRVTRDPNNLGGNAVRLYGDDGVVYYGAHLLRYGTSGRVTAGTTIGYVGNTGDAAGGPTHLHFEVHPAGGPAVNPYPTLIRACR
jgi:murein DD-endopeptidase MepM/ murein hydrolase activator NlpD